jgi:hypothetical protein
MRNGQPHFLDPNPSFFGFFPVGLYVPPLSQPNTINAFLLALPLSDLSTTIVNRKGVAMSRAHLSKASFVSKVSFVTK